MKKIKGVVPVLHTPIDQTGAVDINGLERLVDFLCNNSIGGLWVLGTGSEDMNLTYDQRLKVAECVISTNNNRVPLVIGSSFFCFDDILNFFKSLDRLDFPYVHVMPYHPLFSLDRLEFFYSKLAKYAPRPLWMYTSANWCRHVPPSFVKKMKGTRNIFGVKYSTSNTVDLGKVAELADDSFNVLSAVISTFYSSLCLGVDGSTSSVGSPLPEVLIDIYKEFLNNNHAKALKLQRELNNFMSEWPNSSSKHNFLKSAEEKTILKIRNICDQYTTSYYKDCNEEDISVFKQLIQKYYPSILK